MGPIGSAVLTIIGYRQTDKQTDKPNLYIDEELYYIDKKVLTIEREEIACFAEPYSNQLGRNIQILTILKEFHSFANATELKRYSRLK